MEIVDEPPLEEARRHVRHAHEMGIEPSGDVNMEILNALTCIIRHLKREQTKREAHQKKWGKQIAGWWQAAQKALKDYDSYGQNVGGPVHPRRIDALGETVRALMGYISEKDLTCEVTEDELADPKLLNRFHECETIESLIFQVIGAGSTCWENISGAGIFQSDLAKVIGDDAMERLYQLREQTDDPRAKFDKYSPPISEDYRGL